MVNIQNFNKISSDISFLINTAIATAKIKKLVFKEDEGEFEARTAMHVILRSPIGNVKSTILGEVSSVVNQEIITEITQPGLVGSIDSKTLQAIPGQSWHSRNSLLLLDEFNLNREAGSWQCFLQLLESQAWSKRIGVFSGDMEEKDGDLYFKTKKGQIDVLTRFACIMGTMKKFEYIRNQEFRAFVSRCVPYYYEFNTDEQKMILQGTSIFRFRELHVLPEVTVDNKVYGQIVRTTLDEINKTTSYQPVRDEIFLRAVGDACRVWAVWNNQSGVKPKLVWNRIRDVVRWKVQGQELIGKSYRMMDDAMSAFHHKKLGMADVQDVTSSP